MKKRWYFGDHLKADKNGQHEDAQSQDKIIHQELLLSLLDEAEASRPSSLRTRGWTTSP